MFLNAVQDPNIKNGSLNEFWIQKTLLNKYSNHFYNDIQYSCFLTRVLSLGRIRILKPDPYPVPAKLEN